MVYNFVQETVLETQVFNDKNLLLIFTLDLFSTYIHMCVCIHLYNNPLGVIPIFSCLVFTSPDIFTGNN